MTGAPRATAPPVARRAPRRDVVHGDVRVDDYAWLREKASRDVAAYLEAENAYTRAVMEPTEALQEALYKEMLARIKETDLSVPFREGEYLYYARTEAGRQYPVRCRKRNAPGAPEEVLLDLNELAKGHAFLDLGVCLVSDSGNLLAYTLDTTGFRRFTLSVKDLRTGAPVLTGVEGVTSVAWAADDATLFYTVEDEATKRPHRLYRRCLGDTEPTLILDEPDERFSLGVARSRSRAYLFVTSSSHTASEERFLHADQPEGSWRLVAPREENHEYYIDHRGDLFYVRTNGGARNFRMAVAPVADPRRERWTELVPHRENVMLEDHDLFQSHLVLTEREEGLPHLAIRDLTTGETHRVAFGEPVYSVFPTSNREFSTSVLRYQYESLVTPKSIYDYDMVRREATLLKRTEVLGGFDAESYASERVFATAPDGVRVPVSLVYRKGFARDGRAPMFLSGYGSYGYPNPVGFSSNLLSLLDRGAVVADAHVRGGGEMGKAWHDQGRMRAKRNTFTDFIAVAEHLVAERYTSADRLVIGGRSAGGLLIGAVVNMRPDLFKAALLWVPFVDVVNTMLDDSLPLTVGEYEEWGNPAIREEYEYIKSYCPYTNLEAKDYPALLVKTSLNDSQVMYWEPAKYVAKLRTLKTDPNPLLFLTNMAAGHGGASGRYDTLREAAFDTAFMLWQMGLTKSA